MSEYQQIIFLYMIFSNMLNSHYEVHLNNSYLIIFKYIYSEFLSLFALIWNMNFIKNKTWKNLLSFFLWLKDTYSRGYIYYWNMITINAHMDKYVFSELIISILRQFLPFWS